jgi:transcription antitermination factor NusA-like protein
VKDIEREAKGPQIVLSRGDVGLLIKLFEMPRCPRSTRAS